MQYGLFGQSISHSFSPYIHSELGGYNYQLWQGDAFEFSEFLNKKNFAGLNVTMPYKKIAFKHCNTLSDAARATMAVNTIVNNNGLLCGHNTDAEGLEYLLHSGGVNIEGSRVLVLGSGATARTAAYVAHSRGAAAVYTASRTPHGNQVSYQKAPSLHPSVIINTTPIGTSPNSLKAPLQLHEYTELSAVVDVVYSPICTNLMWQAKQRGILALGGLGMLVAQAKAAAQLFLRSPIPDEKIELVHTSLLRRYANLTLIGMPTVGKSELAVDLSKTMHRPACDLDAMVEKQAGCTIPQIFSRQGEQAFRELESIAAAEAGGKTGQVIAAGGGTVLKEQNVFALGQNGPLIWLNCPPHQLTPSANRPLAQSHEALQRLYAIREPIYRKAADAQVLRSESRQQTISEVQSAFERWVVAQVHPNSR